MPAQTRCCTCIGSYRLMFFVCWTAHHSPKAAFLVEQAFTTQSQSCTPANSGKASPVVHSGVRGQSLKRARDAATSDTRCCPLVPELETFDDGIPVGPCVLYVEQLPNQSSISCLADCAGNQIAEVDHDIGRDVLVPGCLHTQTYTWPDHIHHLSIRLLAGRQAWSRMTTGTASTALRPRRCWIGSWRTTQLI